MTTISLRLCWKASRRQNPSQLQTSSNVSDVREATYDGEKISLYIPAQESDNWINGNIIWVDETNGQAERVYLKYNNNFYQIKKSSGPPLPLDVAEAPEWAKLIE